MPKLGGLFEGSEVGMNKEHYGDMKNKKEGLDFLLWLVIRDNFFAIEVQ